MQAHFSLHMPQRSHQEVPCPHPELDRSKGVLVRVKEQENRGVTPISPGATAACSSPSLLWRARAEAAAALCGDGARPAALCASTDFGDQRRARHRDVSHVRTCREYYPSHGWKLNPWIGMSIKGQSTSTASGCRSRASVPAAFAHSPTGWPATRTSWTSTRASCT